MKRHMVFLVLAAAALQSIAFAQNADDAAKANDSKLPIKRVVLFSSGVGYFQHQGKVDGDASVDFKFRVDNINDLLKSMTLEDRGGGQISTVTYGSRDPITKTLQTFSIDLTKSPTLGQLLSQIRGEKIEVDSPSKVEGTIIGVEKRKIPIGDKQVVEAEFLNLLTDGGLRQIALDSVGRIKLANPQLDAELRQALTVLATGLSTDKKTVTLKFLGKGSREVRVGYIQEAPVWKTSYRLVLDEKDKPFLQGWAIVENTTDADWSDVRLSLVSGRPISFTMDLYSPLYARRPLVVPELFASLTPQLYEQNLSRSASLGTTETLGRYDRPAPAAAPAVAAAKGVNRGRAMAEGRRGGMGGGGGGGGNADSDSLINDSTAAGETMHFYSDFGTQGVRASVQASARGGDVGELFQYDIQNPVTLARLRSAMLPIINDPIEGKKISIYNASVDPKHPLNGVELKNTSKLHLMQGPVTVFDGGVYAGDARIPDLSPGSERLLSYAMDLDVEIAPTSDARPQRLMSARIEKGVLSAEYKQSRKQSYTIKNSGHNEKTVLVEYPIQQPWKLVAPKEPTEKTRDAYRFAVTAKPKEPADLTIEEELVNRQDVALTNLNDDAIRFYLSANVISESIKQALREVVRRKGELAELNRHKSQIEEEIKTIGTEQDRIRHNMEAIGKNSDLYNRYVKKFTDQEDQIEKNRDSIRDLDQQIAKAQKSLDEYLESLKLT
jgi:hypothetical protein